MKGAATESVPPASSTVVDPPSGSALPTASVPAAILKVVCDAWMAASELSIVSVPAPCLVSVPAAVSPKVITVRPPAVSIVAFPAVVKASMEPEPADSVASLPKASVAPAAVQGLHFDLTSREAEIEALRRELDEFRRRLESLLDEQKELEEPPPRFERWFH